MWKTTKLGDVLKTSAGGTPLKSKKNYYAGGAIKWLLSGAVCQKDIHDSKTHITEEGLANSSAKLFPSNTVLVAMYGATAGQVGILRTEAATNQAVCGIYPNEDYLPEFLYYYLINYKETLLLEVSGVAQPNLSQVKIKNIPLPLISLAEQQRIVAQLDAAFGEIDKAITLNENKKDSAADALAAYMEQVFRASLLEYKQSTLGELCEFHNGKAHEKDISEDGEFYVVNSKFISSDGTVAKYTNKQMFPLVTGDIVMVMSDVPNGKALAKAMQINEDGKYSLNQRICCIRSNHYHPQFLQAVLNRHPHFLKFNNGENQTNLRKNDILECPLPVIPLSEQISLLQSIQLFTQETHKLSKIYNEQSRNYDALKSAILALELQSEAA